jgi:glycosyltransferase involved in cell wall biosynthesis
MKKHILFIIENRAVPYDSRVWFEALATKKWGFDVSVISPKEAGADSPYENLEGIDIYRHPLFVNTKGKLGYVLEYASAFFWELLLSIFIYFKKPFHIIHAGNPPDTIYFVGLFFKIFRVKFIFDHHDLSPELFCEKFKGQKNIVYRILVLCEKLSCKLADVVISTNESYKKIVSKRHKIDSKKIFVVRNDPVLSRCLLKADDNYSKNEDKNILLYIGSINRQDGVDVFIEAIKFLVDNLNEKNFIAYIVGDGDYFENIKQKAKKLNMNGFVKFEGYIYDREKINEYLLMADICIEPAPDNAPNRYSTFIKVMEYMAAAKPIIAFNLDETKYSAKGSAIFVQPGDIMGFAEAIKTIIHKPALREQMGKAGQKRIKEKLNWGKSLKNLHRAYEYISCCN